MPSDAAVRLSNDVLISTGFNPYSLCSKFICLRKSETLGSWLYKMYTMMV